MQCCINNTNSDVSSIQTNKGNVAKLIGKILFSGVIAFAILEFLCFFYYNPPIHYTCQDGATDYVWEASNAYADYTEGMGRGRTNNEGYVNPFDYSENMSIDILILGSSQMEAFQLLQEESTAGQLRFLLPESTVYNIGVSAHTFLNCASNLEAAVSKYQPKKCVILETSKISYSAEDLSNLLAGDIAELSSHSDGIVALLMQSNYVRLLVKQAKSFISTMNAKKVDVQQKEKDGQQSSQAIKDLQKQLLLQMKGCVDTVGAELIILYHPSLRIEVDGSASSASNRDVVTSFSGLCEEVGVEFLDMTDKFLKEYQENSLLPHGFPKSSLGSGHLNRYGHRMIAEEISRLISEE